VERFAGDRHQSVSSAAAYLLQQGLRQQPGREAPGTGILEMLRKSFTGLTEEERMLVDGIILEDPAAGSK
jgi:hypothetical protein